MKPMRIEIPKSVVRLPELGVTLWQHGWLLALACALCFVGPPVQAQDYTTSTGITSSAAIYPAEMGIVDAASGDLQLNIPLGSYPQRGLRPYDLKLTYDSHIWSSLNDGVGGAWLPNNTLNNKLSGGWSFGTPGFVSAYQSPTFCNSACSYDLELFDQLTGTPHWFSVFLPIPQTGTEGIAEDDFGLQLLQPGPGESYQLVSQDGTTEYVSGNTKVSLQEDSNGNYFDYDTGLPTAPSGASPDDTLGARFLYTWNSGSGCSFTAWNALTYPECYQISTSTSAYPPLTFTLADVPLNTHFQLSGVTEYTNKLTVVTSVTLPDGGKYSFQYDCDSSTGNAACSSPKRQWASSVHRGYCAARSQYKLHL
jgi:hypothetical protein